MLDTLLDPIVLLLVAGVLLVAVGMTLHRRHGEDPKRIRDHAVRDRAKVPPTPDGEIVAGERAASLAAVPDRPMRKYACIATSWSSAWPGAGSASAAAPAEFYGVVGGKFDPAPADFERMGAGKVGSVRVNLAWATVQRNGPSEPYDWSRYDALMSSAAQNGIDVLLTIYGTPDWAAPRPNHPPPAAYVDEFEAFVRAAVERYGPGGTFWLLNPLLPNNPVTDWQLFNESNSPSYWLPKPKAKQYKPFLVVANRAIKAVDPNATLILAGLFSTPRIKNGVTLQRYLTDLYRLKTQLAVRRRRRPPLRDHPSAARWTPSRTPAS